MQTNPQDQIDRIAAILDTWEVDDVRPMTVTLTQLESGMLKMAYDHFVRHLENETAMIKNLPGAVQDDVARLEVLMAQAILLQRIKAKFSLAAHAAGYGAVPKGEVQ